ncbi:MAG: hypothetical protein ACFFB3_10875 [Candidatus Hodarchaeota archaeon]
MRRIRAPTETRYNWRAKATDIDFARLAGDIANVPDNAWQLYDFINRNVELDQLTESMEYGHSSLKKHLLLLTNLIVQDFLAGKLESLNHGRDAVTKKKGRIPLLSR